MTTEQHVTTPATQQPDTTPAALQPTTQRTIAVIDGNSLMHRAFHAVQAPMTAPDGRATNACFGFLSMFLKLVEDFAPSGIICAFDHGIPAFRLEAIQKYKAQRPPTDPSLKEQFPIIKELLTSLNIPVIELDSWEGDDILGTLADKCESLRLSCLLVSGDKDVLQLASPLTSIINNRTGMSDVIVYDPSGVYDKWGVTPQQVPDFLGLMGDTSDNIPGVPGVGPKTATKLIQEYGSLDEVLAHAEGIKGKLGENLRNNKDQALASRKVATIMRDVPVECDLSSVEFPTFDPYRVKEVFQQYRMNSQLKKVLALQPTSLASRDTLSIARNEDTLDLPSFLLDKSDPDSATTPEAPGQSGVYPELGSGWLPGAQGALQGNPALYGDLPSQGNPATQSGDSAPQHGSLTPPCILTDAPAVAALVSTLANPIPQPCAVCLESTQQEAHKTSSQESMSFDAPSKPELLLYIATTQDILYLTGHLATQALVDILQRGVLIAHDTKAVLQALIPKDTLERAAIKPDELEPSRIRDLGLAAYLLDSSQDMGKTQDLLLEYYPDILPDPTPECPQGAITAAALLAVDAMLQQRLQQDGSEECYNRIEMPLVPVLVQMERWGVNVDAQLLHQLSRGMEDTIARLKASAHTEAGEDFNLDSPKQLGVILFEKLKLPVVKKTRTGYSTDAAVLQDLRKLHPLPDIMLEYRELAKLKSTYLDALPALIAPDGHIHTSFNQAITATGRLSSSDPNLQNIPVRSELGRTIRTAFIPSPALFDEKDAVFLSADYSQIELRLLAHLSGDEGLIEAFVEGTDFHASTAARVFGLPLDQVTPQMRSRAKAVNFGIVYGQQAYGLSQSLGISFKEAQEMIDRYFRAYPQVRHYLDDVVAQAHEQGWVATLYGRKRHIRELKSSNPNLRSFGERTAMNHPMQGSAADIIKLAMIEVERRLAVEGFASQMILQVHDELDFNCAASECERLSAMVKDAMEGIVELKVPLVVDISTGPNWALAH